MVKKLTNNPSISDNLIRNLKQIISLRQEEPLRIINFKMIEFFWEIGTLLNKSIILKNNEENSILNNLSEGLYEKYGSLFTQKQFAIMRQFSLSCKKVTLDQIASYINWAHIPSLLTLDTHDKWVFYVRLTIQEQLSPEMLSDQVVQQRFEKSMPFKLQFPEFPFHDIRVIDNKIQVLPIKNFFKEPLLTSCRSFLEPQNNLKNKKLNSSPQVNQLIEEIEEKIKKIQVVYNRHFNLRFNLSLWEIGGEIKRVLINTNSRDNSMLIKTVSLHLSEIFGKLFMDDCLMQYIKFNEQFPEQNFILDFATILPWEYISLLLTNTATNKERFFYAKQAALSGLTLIELKALVNSNVYYKKQFDDSIKNTLFIDNDKNSVFNVDEAIFDLEKVIESSHLSDNIFLNNHFINFINSFKMID